MSDLIFKTDGEETLRIPDPTPGIKCPETKLEIKKMTETITLTLTLEELKLLDKYVEYGEETKELFDKLKDAYPKPKMEHQESGTVDKVEYNGYTYLRINYDKYGRFGGVWWQQIERHKSPMNIVTDDKTRNILEELWYDQVKKSEPTKPMDEVVERLRKKYQAQKLYNRLFELGFDVLHCEDIVALVEDWILDEQNADGSQNVNTELLVEGFNDAIRKMKEMLR